MQTDEKQKCLQIANDRITTFHNIAIHENILNLVESIYGPEQYTQRKPHTMLSTLVFLIL